ncbi:hypothetical protein D3C77_640950 [compost metagenome]
MRVDLTVERPQLGLLRNRLFTHPLGNQFIDRLQQFVEMVGQLSDLPAAFEPRNCRIKFSFAHLLHRIR